MFLYSELIDANCPLILYSKYILYYFYDIVYVGNDYENYSYIEMALYIMS